jgi:hypothetical protein
MTTRKSRTLCAIAAAVAGAFAAPAFSADIFVDDFESGSTSKTMNGVRWRTGSATSVVTDIAHSGTRSLKFVFKGVSSGDDSFAEQRFDLGADYKEITVEFWAYYPNGSEGLGAKYEHRNDTSTDNNKFIRVWKGDTSDGNNGYSSYWIKGGASTLPASGGSSIIGEYGWNGSGVGRQPGDVPDAGSYSSFITSAQLGKWTKFRFHAKAATTGKGDGVLELFRDDVKVLGATNLPWYPHNGQTSAFNMGYILGWANSGFSQTTNIYVDDVRISTGASAPAPMAPSNVTVQ